LMNGDLFETHHRQQEVGHFLDVGSVIVIGHEEDNRVFLTSGRTTRAYRHMTHGIVARCDSQFGLESFLKDDFNIVQELL
jgi:hypothetical protein